MKNKNYQFQKVLMMLILFVFCAVQSFAQSTVTGMVTDGETGEPLPGVNVVVQGTTTGTITDIDGKFSLNVAEDATLEFSFVGYLQETVPVAGQSEVNVVLIQDIQSLDEVVVVGYGTMKRSDVTGSVSSVKKEDIAQTRVANAVQALQGKAAGVDMIRSDGRAGGGYKILIRGSSTLSGSNDPLYIVDGAYYDSDIDINPNDIESIDILKDASATAIYGPQGTNGVVIITTKSGSAGAPKITFNGFWGKTKPLGKIPVMDRQAYLDHLTDIDWIDDWENDNTVKRADYSPDWFWGNNPGEEYGYNHGYDYDWNDALLHDGFQNTYNLGFSGGNEKTVYSGSVNHYNEQGLIKNDNFKRYGIRANVSSKVNDFLKVGVNTIMSHTVQHDMANPFGTARAMSPLLEPYDSLGNLIARPKEPANDFMNPMIHEDEDYYYNEVRKTSLFGTAFAEVTFLKDFTFKTSINADIDYDRDGEFVGVYEGLSGTNRGQVEQTNESQWVWQNILSGNKRIGIHNIQFTAAHEVFFWRSEEFLLETQNLAQEKSQIFRLNSGDPLRTESYLESRARVAYIGRLHYSLMDKYMITATLRTEGASVLPDGNKWSSFPGVSLGYNMHNESFMQSLDFISQFKIRGGYGVTGNEGIDPYLTQGQLTDNPLFYEFGVSENVAFGYREEFPTNPKLVWEKTKGTNIGVDIGLYNNRIQLVVDYYKNKTEDLLQLINLTPSSGILSKIANVGNVENKGIEVTIRSIIIDNSEFKLTADLTFQSNKEEIVKLQSGRPENLLDGWFVGHPVDAFYDYNKIGIWQIGDTTGYYSYENFPNEDPGNPKYENLDTIFEIGEPDRQIVGTPRPKWSGGLKTKVEYKGFDFSVFIFARIGQTIGDGVRYHGIAGNVRETQMDVDYWTPVNPTNDYPSPLFIGNRSGNPWRQSLAFVDGSFVKVRDITLGYTLPQKWSSIIGVSNLRLYGTVQNAFVFGKYFDKGNRYDPELEGWRNTTGDDNRRITAQIDGSNINIPTPKMFGVGIDVTF